MPDDRIEDALMVGVDEHQVMHLTKAFDVMAQRLGGITNSTAMWAIATMLARIFAAASLDEDVMSHTGQRFSDMLRAAYPMVVKAIEETERERSGRPAYDA